MLAGKKVAILGAGRSGLAAAALAVHLGGDVTIYDTRAGAQTVPKDVKFHPGATVATGNEVIADMVVVSPGIDTYGDFVQAFATGSGELIGEVELAARVYKGKVIAITGTNGKTTTTEIIERIMNQSGISCLACGNYGIPLSEVVLRDEVPETVALELSSFQLETTDQLNPDVIVWLNFSADHLDRYPDLEAYKEAKLRIFKNVSAETALVIRAGEDVGSLEGQQVRFSTEIEAEWSLDDGWLCFHGSQTIDLSATYLRGLHNAENTMAAAAACFAAGGEWSKMQAALIDFKPPRHRCEFIREVNGVEYINDSKATNIHALESAIRSFPSKIVLIAGGKQKGLDYQGLLTNMVPNVKAAVVFGEIANNLNQLFSPAVQTEAVETLDTAVTLAKQYAEPGELVLFSPGTSSFDQYQGYEDRGDHFRELVMSL